MFGVSVPQASKDLTLYQVRAPGNVEYDKSAKRYVASRDFQPKFLQPDSDTYLSRLRTLAEGLAKPSESWIGYRPDSDIALTPHREVEAKALRAVLDAMRDAESIEVLYQSMNSVRPTRYGGAFLLMPSALTVSLARARLLPYRRQVQRLPAARILDVRSPGTAEPVARTTFIGISMSRSRSRRTRSSPTAKRKSWRRITACRTARPSSPCALRCCSTC